MIYDYIIDLGLGGYDGITKLDNGCTLRTMIDSMKLLNHHYVDVLKMDIEGFEFSWANHELSTLGKRLGQVLIEMHSTGGDAYALVQSFEKHGLRIFHQEINPQKALWGAEYSFIQAEWSKWEEYKYQLTPL